MTFNFENFSYSAHMLYKKLCESSKILTPVRQLQIVWRRNAELKTSS